MSTVSTMDEKHAIIGPSSNDAAATTASTTSTAVPAATAASTTSASLALPTPIVSGSTTPSRGVSTRRPVRPFPPSLPRSDLPYWLAWFLHAVDLDELPIPAALFHRSILSSPLLYWFVSCVLYLFNVTQQYNRIRNPPLLSRHPQYQYSLVSLRRYEQCLAESWMAALALLCCGMCVLLLSVAVLSTGPSMTFTTTTTEQQQQQQQRQQEHRSEAVEPMQQLRLRHAQAMQRVANLRARGGSASEDVDSSDRHSSNWACIAVLAVLFFSFWVLRHMATIKWPQYQHGNVWSVIQ